jgi:uridine phosphorylase
VADGDNRGLSAPPVPVHLHPTAPLAQRALLPGDPGRALALAQELLVEPRMFNHNRGLWGYTGAYRGDGEPLTIQATGLGGPSAAIVLEELAALGLQRAIRVGTASALEATLALGELLVVERALCADGTSAALGALGEVEAEAALLAALAREGGAAVASGSVVSSDLFYESGTERIAAWRERGARALELATAALFALGARRQVAVGCVVAISARVGSEDRIEAEALAQAGLAAGALAAAALAA